MKTAFVFPGQGAQYIGMAMDLAESREEYSWTLQEFDRINQTQLWNIMRDGPESALQETRYTQPAILFHSIAALKLFQTEIGIKPDYVAGHSLGEFSALVANNTLQWLDAMYLVHKRGEFMIRANQDRPFAMAAVIGLTGDTVHHICLQVTQTYTVVAANFNTPEQTVISGTREGVEAASRLAEEAGAKKIVPLAVGGPFHSPLITRAEEWLNQEIAKINFSQPEIPVITNVDASPTTNLDKIRYNLAKQVTSPVLWVDTINFLISRGIDLIFEFGPKNVLAGMIKKINRDLPVINIDKLTDIEKAKIRMKEL
ncbi:MAG: ACP S-malonyltransferase [Candidatus Cloacimonetes bacterium]|nr:ACP S-malonyltransferase [Candidatus Cloacimonadota bacterium]